MKHYPRFYFLFHDLFLHLFSPFSSFFSHFFFQFVQTIRLVWRVTLKKMCFQPLNGAFLLFSHNYRFKRTNFYGLLFIIVCSIYDMVTTFLFHFYDHTISSLLLFSRFIVRLSIFLYGCFDVVHISDLHAIFSSFMGYGAPLIVVHS